MKKLGILTVLLIIAFTGGAQTQKNETEGFSFGAKLGFSSTLPIINSLTIEGVEAQNVNLQYQSRLPCSTVLPYQYRPVFYYAGCGMEPRRRKYQLFVA